jgi:hypothetical protein
VDRRGAPTQDGRVVSDIDATLIDAHSEKEQASRTWKKGFGFHLDAALAQVPAPLRARDAQGRVAVLVRTDAAGATKEFARHLAATGVEFSLGANLGHFDIHTALAALPTPAWTPAYQAMRSPSRSH